MHNLDNIYEFVLNNKQTFPFIKKSPVFFKDDSTKLKEFVNKYVSKKNRELLYYVDNARIRPSSDFANLMTEAIKGQPIFSLDDEQQNAVSTIVHETNMAIDRNQRTTIIIRGGAGTGKSLVAINALGLLLNPNDGSKSKTQYMQQQTLHLELYLKSNWLIMIIEKLLWKSYLNPIHLFLGLVNLIMTVFY